MAICQAIASNTFNVCICLALLWLVHTLGLGLCDYGSHGAHHLPCGGCYAPNGFKPLCPFWEKTNNAFGSAGAWPPRPSPRLAPPIGRLRERGPPRP